MTSIDLYRRDSLNISSIYEKTSGDASLTHGWSSGIASLLVEKVNLI
jgi:hypothetical protein